MGENVAPVCWGSPGDGLVEWNIWNDPHAAAIVLRALVPRLVLVPLDVTTRVKMGSAEASRRFQGGLLDTVMRFAGVWFQDRPVVTFHNPLAAVLLFDEGMCGYTPGRVEVELRNFELEGFTRFHPSEDGPHTVVTTVEPTRFFDSYFGVLGQVRGLTAGADYWYSPPYLYGHFARHAGPPAPVLPRRAGSGADDRHNGGRGSLAAGA